VRSPDPSHPVRKWACPRDYVCVCVCGCVCVCMCGVCVCVCVCVKGEDQSSKLKGEYINHQHLA